MVPAFSEPFDSSGNAGATNYLTLPFQSQIYNTCWNCSPNLEPAELFFQANPGSVFNNASTMSSVRYYSAQQEAQGIIPSGGAQRWEDTYEASFPAGTFPGEPSWIQNDRASRGFPNMPDFVAWRNFISSHPQYADYAYDGGTMPPDANYFRSWGGQWGHLSPLTPLDQPDCPPDMTAGCTWGDSYAYRWGLTSQLSGGYGIMLADFSDSQPGRPSNLQNFNARIVAAFGTAYKLTVPTTSPTATSGWIVANAYNKWNDYLSIGYGKFYAALAARLGTATNRTALVIDQCSNTPSYRRLMGTDQRIIAKRMSAKSYMCIWDDQITQAGRAGPVTSPPTQELAGFAIAAAREPLVRNGANLEADDPAYWSAIASFYPSLSPADQQEVGYKLMKRLWLWSSWAHIADRSGKLRRALAFTSRDYWDSGVLTAGALGPLQSLIQTIYPAKPFGAALYYPTSVERIVEASEGATAGTGWPVGYLPPQDLQAFIDGGGGLGYYVSDAALGAIAKGSANAPSAWVLLDAGNMLPASEMSRLQAIAPVVTSVAGLAAVPGQPLTFSAGLTGFGFFDQNGRRIVVVTNPATSPGAGTVSGTVNLAQLGSGALTVTNLFTNAVSSLTPSNGQASLSVSLARWDTQVLAISN